MQKVDLKKHILKISLIFILMICAFLCIYAVSNYKSNNINTQNNQFRGQGSSSNNDANNMQNNQKPPENIPSSDGNVQSNQNMQSHQNGGVTPQNENRQKGMASSNGNKQSGQNGNTNTKYLPALTTYSAIFLILCIGIYYLFRRKNIKINFADEKILIFTLLAVGLLLRIAASTLMEGHNDVNLFKNWASTAANSLSQFYSNARSADYPPLYIYVLALIGKIASTSAFSSYFTLLQIAGVFTFSAGMHERYLFPAVALSILAFIYLKDRRFFILSIGFSITSYINMSAVLFSLNSSNFNILLMITSLLNVLLVGYLVKVLFDNAFKKIQTL